jgi:hypothetical protein
VPGVSGVLALLFGVCLLKTGDEHVRVSGSRGAQGASDGQLRTCAAASLLLAWIWRATRTVLYRTSTSVQSNTRIRRSPSGAWRAALHDDGHLSPSPLVRRSRLSRPLPREHVTHLYPLARHRDDRHQ